ncbi:MAG TPA: hypothetical protein VGA34_13445 [Alteraurantiacibacter sp.]
MHVLSATHLETQAHDFAVQVIRVPAEAVASGFFDYLRQTGAEAVATQTGVFGVNLLFGLAARLAPKSVHQ